MSNLETTALISAFINSGITLFKFVLAGISGSIALLADAWHSFSDIFSSIGVFIALKKDRKERTLADSKQDIKIFRKAGWETKIALTIGLFLLFVCWEILLKIVSSKSTIISYPLPIAMGISLLAFFSYLLYRYEYYVGKKNNSPGLIADGLHSKVDMYASIVIVFNLISSYFSFDIDKPVAFLICLFVAKHAWHVLTDSFRSYSQQRKQLASVNLSSSLSLEDVFLLFLKQKLIKGIGRVYRPAWLKSKIKRQFLIFLILAVLIVYFSRGFYIIVNPQEEAIVEFFGQPKPKILKPGLHYRIPFPVEKVRVINTKKVRTLIIGSVQEEAGLPILWTNLHTPRETFFITGDFSLLNANLCLHYNIKDPYAYFYNISSPEKLLEVFSYAQMRALFGRKPFFSIITEERAKLEADLR
ncbi:MAG: cation transporter, partial [Candidatus Omnitrophica bacterium]|nr:cation transporter [Candidatus Omnitrophota bacterium]